MKLALAWKKLIHQGTRLPHLAEPVKSWSVCESQALGTPVGCSIPGWGGGGGLRGSRSVLHRVRGQLRTDIPVLKLAPSTELVWLVLFNSGDGEIIRVFFNFKEDI